jgi:PAS domain S-box-containing protein
MHELRSIIKPYVSFYEVLRDGILITDLDGDIVFSNPATELILQVMKKSIIKKNSCTIFSDKDTFHDFVMELGVEKKIIRDVDCIVDGSVKKCHICANTIYNDNNDPAGVMFIFLRKNYARLSLPELEKGIPVLSALNHHTDEIVVIGDVRIGCNVFCSQALEHIMGWKPDDFIIGGWGFVVSLTHPDDINRMAQAYQAGIKSRSKSKNGINHIPIEFEYRKKHKDGSWRWMNSKVFILEYDESGHIALTITFLRDITIEKLHGVSLEKEISQKDFTDGLKSLWSGESRVVHESFITTREKQVLELVRDGNSTKNIASSLGLTVASVNSFRKRLMEKLEAKNTAELVRRSYELKLFEE